MLEEQVQLKSGELIKRDLNQVAHYQKLLNYKQLIEEEYRTPGNMPKPVREVWQDLALQTDDKARTEQFFRDFDEVYPGYLQQLTDRHPDLSFTEKKICLYLRLNRTNLQIAEASNIAFRSVLRYRQRLKDKLSLESSEQLEGYLKEMGGVFAN